MLLKAAAILLLSPLIISCQMPHLESPFSWAIKILTSPQQCWFHEYHLRDSLLTRIKLALVNLVMIWVGGLVPRICGIMWEKVPHRYERKLYGFRWEIVEQILQHRHRSRTIRALTSVVMQGQRMKNKNKNKIITKESFRVGGRWMGAPLRGVPESTLREELLLLSPVQTC